MNVFNTIYLGELNVSDLILFLSNIINVMEGVVDFPYKGFIMFSIGLGVILSIYDMIHCSGRKFLGDGVKTVVGGVIANGVYDVVTRPLGDKRTIPVEGNKGGTNPGSSNPGSTNTGSSNSGSTNSGGTNTGSSNSGK